MTHQAAPVRDRPVVRTDAGLTFSETMAGGFSLTATDPDAGAADAKDVLMMQVRLTIPGIDLFLADPEHEGTLEGSITFPPLGTRMPAIAGRFRLFTRSADPLLKLMAYRMTFERESRVYTLYGEKHVRRGSALRAWRDTTTLRCRLHAGPDETGAVCGAGILRISVPGFVRQLLSFRAVDGGGPGSRAAAFGRFLGFFSRELIDSYL